MQKESLEETTEESLDLDDFSPDDFDTGGVRKRKVEYNPLTGYYLSEEDEKSEEIILS